MEPGGSESSERLSLSFQLTLTFLRMTQKQKQKKTSRRILRPTETHKDLLVETGAALWCRAHQLSMCSTLEKNWCLNTQHPAKNMWKYTDKTTAYWPIRALESSVTFSEDPSKIWQGRGFSCIEASIRTTDLILTIFLLSENHFIVLYLPKQPKNTVLKTQASYYII